ncbi:hydroxyisourate hydrolase [Azorhizobium caulinodans]|uniref:hydroxyisourate hydrolase n=1 Tax=Azorhizobium caulinodans TaxID=7 RepID=UPI002FBE97BC
MGRLSTHVLDTVLGRPAAGVRVELFAITGDGTRQRVAERQTNADGRTDTPLMAGEDYRAGTYELVFHMGAYFRSSGAPVAEPPFLDEVPLRVTLSEDGHYHVPLLCSPWAYSTYRGS